MAGDGHVDLDEQGLPGRRDCPACGSPLEPGFIDDSIALAWMCPLSMASFWSPLVAK